MKILIVEDEPKLNAGMVAGFVAKGFLVDSAHDGEEGEKLAKWNQYDAIIMDIMMSKRDGLTVVKNLRAAGKTTPIILLTAKDAYSDRVKGLDDGADDYVVKPFSFEELVARVRAVLRRPASIVSDILELDAMRVDTKAQTVAIDGQNIELTLREYGLLEYFMRHPNTVITRDDLLEHVWDRNYDSFSNVVDVHLKNVRKKLPKAYAKRIQTVWGKGYRLV